MNRRLPVLQVTALAALCVIAAIALNSARMAAAENSVPEAQAPVVQLPEVAVTLVRSGDYRARVSGFGEARSQFQLDLTTEVAGRVTQLSEQFASGRQVRAGELLAQLDATAYQQKLAAARSALAQAELKLLEEQRQGKQAQQEWLHSGLAGEPDSPLVLRQPQLRAAQAAVEEARSQITAAQQDLDNTRIRAPFDALVVSREIQPGSAVQAGTQIGTLYSTQRLEISVPLSAQQWRNLPDAATLDEQPWPLSLHSSDGEQQWQAHAERVAQHLDSSTRQRSLVAVVDNPLALENPLYPGTFTKVLIEGRELQQVWKIPAAAITQSGFYWLVDAHQQLRQATATVVFADAGYSYVVPPAGLAEALIVVRPLNSYLAGMRINPRQEPQS